jgi:hypothetical protein
MAEFILNGVLEEDAGKFFHVCCFSDQKGYDPENEDNYIFIPKSVCTLVDHYTIAVQDWYVRKKGLEAFIKRKSVSTVNVNRTRTTRQRPQTVAEQRKKVVDEVIKNLGKKQSLDLLKKIR